MNSTAATRLDPAIVARIDALIERAIAAHPLGAKATRAQVINAVMASWVADMEQLVGASPADENKAADAIIGPWIERVAREDAERDAAIADEKMRKWRARGRVRP